MHVPRELLGDDADDHGLVFRRKRPDADGPGWDGIEQEQDHLDDGHSNLGALRNLPVRARVAGPGIRSLAEPEKHEREESAPADEQHQHQPVHEHDHVVDLGGVRRRLPRKPEEL